jgi:hypothetical protein
VPIAATNAFHIPSDDTLQVTSILMGIRAAAQFLDLYRDAIEWTMATTGLTARFHQPGPPCFWFDRL